MKRVNQQHEATESQSSQEIFIPDFCNVRMVFAVVVVAQLLAFIFALGPQGKSSDQWLHLSLISLFVQWVALSNSALLCLLRQRMRNLSTILISGICLVLVELVTLVAGEISFLFTRGSDFAMLIPSSWHVEFLIRNAIISAIVTLLALRFFYLQYQLKINIVAESRARLQALQARIRPHFLFNSMNTIAGLTRSQPELAEAVVEDLADLFRVSLSDAGGWLSLNEELQLCQRYLNIEQIRLGDRLNIEWQKQSFSEDIKIPALSLQPLLENAIYHGIEMLPDGGTISIDCRCSGNEVVVVITNPLPLRRTPRKKSGHHIALDNIRERLAVCFKHKASLDIQSEKGEFRVCMKFHTSMNVTESVLS